MFKITAADAPKNPIVESSPDKAWSALSTRIRTAQDQNSANEENSGSIDGYKRFGLSIRNHTAT